MRDVLQIWKERLPNLTDSDLAYLSVLYDQYRNPSPRGPLRIGREFRPSALLSPAERHDLLGAVDYADLLQGEEEYHRWAKNVILTLNPMNGGIGSSVQRESYLSQLWVELGRKGPMVLGAKGSDLYFEVEVKGIRRKLSVSQAKILRAVRESHFYHELRIQQLASTETNESIRLFMNEPSPLEGKTYRQLIAEEANMRWIDPLLQAALPTVDADGHLTDRRLVPGGHGQWGVHLLLLALGVQEPADGKVLIHAIYNEDGINNTVDPIIAGWMAKENVPIIMLTTTKTSIDKKGGLMGVVRTASSQVRKEMMEKAQADQSGEGALFEEMGLTQGEPGAQYFNTNTALLNYSVLGPFLKELSRMICIGELSRVVSPMLIQNKKKQKEKEGIREYVQLEGALCSTLLNLDGYLTDCNRTDVRDLLSRHGFLDGSGRVRFLRIVNVDVCNRARFFTPIKNAFDFWLQFYSDFFHMNTETWSLEPTRPGFIPDVHLSDEYSDVARVLDAFQGAKVRELDSLKLFGPVRLGGAALRGKVLIENHSGSLVDFSAPAFLSKIGLPTNGSIELRNVGLSLGADGQIVKTIL